MVAQASWVSELPEVNHHASFEVEDTTPAVALESDELRGGAFPRIIGNSAALRRVLDMVRVVAPTDATVLLNGETGTGKELIAEAIHQCSDRANGPLVKVNCAAIPAGLLESELFGHERGAYTGAVARGIGRFEKANGGTLFLDEIGDLPLELQPKLLRVMQERQFERLGGTATIHSDVRVICATHRNLIEMVDKREFRTDLFYRLSVFPIELPPLRDRPEDIRLLVHHFAMEYAARMGKPIAGQNLTLAYLALEMHGRINASPAARSLSLALKLSAVAWCPSRLIVAQLSNGFACPGQVCQLGELDERPSPGFHYSATVALKHPSGRGQGRPPLVANLLAFEFSPDVAAVGGRRGGGIVVRNEDIPLPHKNCTPWCHS